MKITPDRLAVAEAVYDMMANILTPQIVDLRAVIEALPEPEPVQAADKLAGNSDVQAQIDAAVEREREDVLKLLRLYPCSHANDNRCAACHIRARSGGKGE